MKPSHGVVYYLRQVMTGRGVPVAAQLRLTCSRTQYSTVEWMECKVTERPSVARVSPLLLSSTMLGGTEIQH